jgi:hypothetical protein
MTGLKIKIVLLLGALSVFGYLLFTGPRMYVQPHILAYQTIAAPPPPGAVPMTPRPTLLTAQEAINVKNPLPDTPDNLQKGRVYYQYYCLACHGERGDGNGPAGESYYPAPANLNSDRLKKYSDGQLLRAMLLGVGHEPTLEKIVPAEHYWLLVLYTRHFSVSPTP